MAPRRLVLVMILLLAVSTVVAIIAPDPSERSGSGSESGQEREVATPDQRQPSSTGPGGNGKEESGDSTSLTRVMAVEVRTGGDVEVIRSGPGRRIVLEVESDRTTEITIPELGRTATADGWAPAVFDLITPDDRGALTIEDLSSGRVVARVVVR